MNRALTSALLLLAVIGGTASADHRHHERDRGGWRDGGWRGGGSVVVRSSPVVYSPRVVVQPRVRVVRHPSIETRLHPVSRPVLRVRYYNYQQQPVALSENYPATPGYYWVAGQWSWTGYEWSWNPGHYEPDPSYDTQYYQSSSYSQSYESSTPPCNHDQNYDYDGY